MTDQNRSKVIKQHPIGNGLNTFRTSFNSICEGKNISPDPGAKEDLQNLVLVLLSTSKIYPVALLLRSSGNGANLFDDLFRLSSAVNSGEFEPDCIKPLLRSAVTDTPDDTVIWNHLYEICH
uniref:Uncharacterized protein n=1 Tax=Bionectria ochroleuca TaxID=29856 RepID=A0A8H7KD67_BIOOC